MMMIEGEEQKVLPTREGTSESIEIPSFPQTLTYVSNVKQEIPKHVYEKLHHYYIAITNLLLCETTNTNQNMPVDSPQSSNRGASKSSLFLIHQSSRFLKQTIIQEQVLFPTSFLQQFCRYCDCIQVLGITATMRIKNRTKYSPINKKMKSKTKTETVIVPYKK